MINRIESALSKLDLIQVSGMAAILMGDALKDLLAVKEELRSAEKPEEEPEEEPEEVACTGSMTTEP